MGNSVSDKPDKLEEELQETNDGSDECANDTAEGTSDLDQGVSETHEGVENAIDPSFKARAKPLKIDPSKIPPKPAAEKPKVAPSFNIEFADGYVPPDKDTSDPPKSERGREYTKIVIPTVPAPKILEEAVQRINFSYPEASPVEVQMLSEHSEQGIDRFLDKHLNTGTAKRTVHTRELLNLYENFPKLTNFDSPEYQLLKRLMDKLLAGYNSDTKSYYELTAVMKALLSGRIVLQTLALVNGHDTVKDLLIGEDQKLTRICSIGPGDGDILRGIYKARRFLIALLKIRDKIAETGRVVKRDAYTVIDGEVLKFVDTGFYYDPALLGIELTDSFPEILWSEKNIQAISCDAGSPDLFGAHKIGKRIRGVVKLSESSFDQIIAIQVLDRVPDRLTVYDNMKRAAKPGARFTFGLLTQITNVNNVGRKIVHWDENTDLRQLWLHPDPVMAIYYQHHDLMANGFRADRIAMQKYVSLNPECEVDNAENLRRRKDELEEKYFKDGNGEKIHIQILANIFGCAYPEVGIEPTGIFEDDDVVMFPEVGDHTIFSGPIDKDAPTLKDKDAPTMED